MLRFLVVFYAVVAFATVTLAHHSANDPHHCGPNSTWDDYAKRCDGGS